MFKVNNKDTRTTPLLTLNIFTPCSSVSIVNFEQVNTAWVVAAKAFTVTKNSNKKTMWLFNCANKINNCL